MSQEKNQQVHPLAPPSHVMPRSDQEILPTTGGYGGYYESTEHKKRKRMKCLASLTLFSVSLIIIVLFAAFVLFRVRTPRVRLASVRAFNVNGNGNVNGSAIRLTFQVRMRNRNFGRYKFENSVATLRREDSGESVGEFLISKGRARARSTKRIYVLLDVKSPGTGNNSSSPGVLRIRSEAKLRGKVEFLRVFKRRKTAEMDCVMSINLTSYIVQDLNCK